MDLRKLKMLIDLVAESSITELEVTEGEEKIKIVKGYNAAQTQQSHTVMLGASPSPISTNYAATTTTLSDTVLSDNNTPSVATSNGSSNTVPTPKPVNAENKLIKSPMVGTFYAASGPDKPDFVSIGTEVKANQTVCIIEAMKLLNEIEAGIEGTITEILVKNGTPVEFGQPLFRLA
jgi:acetyl-CoA carboxylase biotin carboxyl carrier protein